jgi:hypothetical protein
MEHALACLAAISLRSPGNAQRIVDTGLDFNIAESETFSY